MARPGRTSGPRARGAALARRVADRLAPADATAPPNTVAPPNLRMGRRSYGEPVVYAYPGCTAGVEIGAFCSIGPGATFVLGAGHRAEWVTTCPTLHEDAPIPAGYVPERGGVRVGSDVWIGMDARILEGVTIGHGAIVGAYAVVASDVRPYDVVVGNPARPVRRRFPDDVCERLLATAWWAWPTARLEALEPLLWSADVEAFLRAAESGASPAVS